MHGLIYRAIQCFMRDIYGKDAWLEVANTAELGFTEFEAMLTYDDALADPVLNAMSELLDKPRESILEDIGTYLVSNPKVESLRRLLRFGGVNFIEFLHSLDDLPDRARLAVSDLGLPKMELREHNPNSFSLTVNGNQPGWGHVLVGVLRAMADDYGAFAFLEHQGGRQGVEIINITLVISAHGEGRSFELGAQNSPSANMKAG